VNDEARTHLLSIFLIKAKFKLADEIVNIAACAEPVSITIAGHETALLFTKKNPPKPPRWAALFEEFVDPAQLAVEGVAGVLLIRAADRSFALAFGQGGRFLLKDDTFEDRFGLLCTLNSVDPESIRCVDVQSLDAIQSHTRIQAGQETSSDQFGLNVEQDMLKAIVGSPLQPELGNRMAGSDALSVSVKMRLSDLPQLLKRYLSSYQTDLKGKDYEWVNNIALVKSESKVEELEALLDARLMSNDFKDVWLAIPEIIEWAGIAGFAFTGGKGVTHHDVTWKGFLEATGGAPSVQLLKERRVYCIDADHKRTGKGWSVYKCAYAELSHAQEKFILNDGKWFRVAGDFVSRTNDEFVKIASSSLQLDDYKDGGEGAYNCRIATTRPDEFALLDDKMKIMHGGGQGQVEVCDLFSKNRELIHVKMYGKSSVFSHLFAQGFVSGQLLQVDSSFREKVRSKLPTAYKTLVPGSAKPKDGEFTIVYAVISNDLSQTLYLPFFSRVNLNNTARILRGFGYKVELLKIRVDPIFAVTTKIPPKKSKVK
jgi:uncharacterized protein (TIGR04141 family)